MTKADDLKVGMFIAIVGAVDGCNCQECVDAVSSGRPFLILAISLPFIAVQDGEDVYSLDYRLWYFQKMSWPYARALGWRKTKPKRNAEAAASGVCQKCGTKLVERLITTQDRRASWLEICPSCEIIHSRISSIRRGP